MATIEELEQRSEQIANAEAAAVAWLVEAMRSVAVGGEPDKVRDLADELAWLEAMLGVLPEEVPV